MAKEKSRYRPTPIGVGRYCWINKPDTKFNPEGVYKYDHVLEGEEADRFRTEIDLMVEAAFDEITADLKPADRKKWERYYPYVIEEDDEGKPTGRIAFKLKQNAKIRLHDGSIKHFKMGIRDSKNKAINDNVFGGSVLRALWSPRTIKLETAKKAGVRMDFCMVQLIKPAPSSGGGFDEVEGGYTPEEHLEESGKQDAPDRAAADY